MGNEGIFSHDFFVLTAWNGSRFVFDPTGYQFGFEKYLYTYEEYEAECLDPKDTPEFPNSYSEFNEARNGALGGNKLLNDAWVLRDMLGDKTRDEIQAGDVW